MGAYLEGEKTGVYQFPVPKGATLGLTLSGGDGHENLTVVTQTILSVCGEYVDGCLAT